jgi:Uma2 family endonuclease
MAISLRLAGPPTDDEIRALSERNPGYQFERTAAGELVVTPNGTPSGRSEAELLIQLGIWAKVDGTGIVFSSSTGFRLPDGSLLVPDASWVRRERWNAVLPLGRGDFALLCPDAVFEIRSPSNTVTELRAKMATYVSNGARLAVLIDPERRTVEVYAPGEQLRIHDSASSLPCDPVLPGFTLELAPIFE